MRKLIAIFILVLIICLGLCCIRSIPEPVTKKIILTENAPKPVGPYSQAVLVGNTLYCAGQIAIDPKTSEMVTESIEAETRQVLDNLAAVLHAAGFGLNDVVQVTVYMVDMDNYARINKVYAEYFKQEFPARCAVQVARLPKGAGVEIMVTAVKTDK